MLAVVDKKDEPSAPNPALEALNEACRLFFRPDSVDVGVDMKCPFCGAHIPELWQPTYATTMGDGRTAPQAYEQLETYLGMVNFVPTRITIGLRWMICPNVECKQIVVEVGRSIED